VNTRVKQVTILYHLWVLKNDKEVGVFKDKEALLGPNKEQQETLEIAARGLLWLLG